MGDTCAHEKTEVKTMSRVDTSPLISETRTRGLSWSPPPTHHQGLLPGAQSTRGVKMAQVPQAPSGSKEREEKQKTPLQWALFSRNISLFKI